MAIIYTDKTAPTPEDVSTGQDVADYLNDLSGMDKIPPEDMFIKAKSSRLTELAIKKTDLKAMDSPPTIAISTTNPLASGQAFDDSNRSVISGRRAISSSNLSIFNGGYFTTFGVNSGQEQVVYSRNTTTTTSGGNISSTIRLSFLTSASQFSVKVRAFAGFGTELLIKVNDEFVSLTPTAVPEDNAIHYVSVDFGSSESRRIDIIGYKLLFGGVYVGLQDTIVAAERRGPKAFMIGDSFSDGTGNEVGSALSFPIYMQEFLGIDDLTLSAVGGTGLIRGDGGKANYQFRFQRDIVDLMPSDEFSLVWISLSINDQIYTVEQVETALTSLFDMLDNSGKLFSVFVSSPTIADGAGLMPEILIDHNEALKTLTQSRGHTFIDEITMPTGAITPHATTITANVAQDATTLSTFDNLIAGANYRFDDGTLFFVRSSDTATRIATVDNIRTAQTNGANITLVGSTYLTGNGDAGSPTGWGNSDVAVSSDSLHPTNFGHKLKGLNCSRLLLESVEGI